MFGARKERRALTQRSQREEHGEHRESQKKRKSTVRSDCATRARNLVLWGRLHNYGVGLADIGIVNLIGIEL